MIKYAEFHEKLKNGDYDNTFAYIYGNDENMLNRQRERYDEAAKEFVNLYGDKGFRI